MRIFRWTHEMDEPSLVNVGARCERRRGEQYGPHGRNSSSSGVRAQYQLREALISMHAHLVMGPEVVVGGVHAKLAEDVYQDENGLTFMLRSLDRLREEILGRRLVYA